MQIPNWKRRRTLSSLLAVPLVASTLMPGLAQAGPYSSSSSNSSRPASPPSRPSYTPPSRPAYTPPPPPPRQSAPAPARETSRAAGNSFGTFGAARQESPRQEAPRQSAPAPTQSRETPRAAGNIFGSFGGSRQESPAAAPARPTQASDYGQRNQVPVTQRTPPPAAPAPAPAPRPDYGPRSAPVQVTQAIRPAQPVQAAPAPQQPPAQQQARTSGYGQTTVPVTQRPPAPVTSPPAPRPDYSPRGSAQVQTIQTTKPAQQTQATQQSAPAQQPRQRSGYEQQTVPVTRGAAVAAGAAAGAATAATQQEPSRPDYSQRPAGQAAPVVVYKPAAPPAAVRSSIPVSGATTPSNSKAASGTAPKASSQSITSFNGQRYEQRNKVTGQSTTYDARTGIGQVKNKSGTVVNDYRMKGQYKENSITYVGANGTQRRRQYYTRPVEIQTSSGGRRTIEHFAPRDRQYLYQDTSSMDYLLMYMMINQSMQNHQHDQGGYYGGGYSGSGGGYSGQPLPPPPPRIPTGFEVSWDQKFEFVPEAYAGGMTYRQPADAVATYVSLDIINENSEFPGFWKKLGSFVTGNGWNIGKKFELDSGARHPITRQVTDMAANMLKNSEVDLKPVIDETTGELVRDKDGKTANYYFIVDPSNAMQVIDVDTQSKCELAIASVLRPVEALITDDTRSMKMKVLAGGRTPGACTSKQTVLVDQSDLEEMNNDLAAKVDQAIHAIPKMSNPVFN